MAFSAYLKPRSSLIGIVDNYSQKGHVAMTFFVFFKIPKTNP
jgi:hypothetical protein